MALNTYPAVASPVKSVQRGSAAGAGTVTITAINTAKSMVNIFGTTSSGTVAVSGAVSAASGNVAAATDAVNTLGQNYPVGMNAGGARQWGNITRNASAVNLNASNLTGGTTNLVSAVVQGYLNSATELIVSGACRWEVVEFN